MIRVGNVLKQVDLVLTPVAARAADLVRWLTSERPGDPTPLIVRPGGMGDLILAHIAFEEMGGDPAAVHWLIERRSEGWAKHQSLRYWCYDREPLKRLWQLAGSRLLVINTEQRFGLAQVFGCACQARTGRIAGFETNRASGRASIRVSYDPDAKHECVAFSELFAAALRLRPLERPPVRRRRVKVQGGTVVALAGLQEPTRSLGLETWCQLLRAYLAGETFKLIAAPGDASFAGQLVDAFGGQASVHTGSFGEACEVLAASRRCFTVDGGMVHVASYYGVPTTAVFTSGRHLKWSPLAAGSEIIRHGALSCQPCTWFGQTRPCRYQHRCHHIGFATHRRPAPAVAVDDASC